jgi:hypothetical protein
MGTLGVDIGVEKCRDFDGSFYRSDIVTNSDVKTAEYAKAAHQLASLNAKFLAKFNYATDYAGNIMDMKLDDDLLEFLYPALIEGYEKFTKKQQKHEEEISRKFNQVSVNMIKRVKYDNPWTIVWWKDGQITRSKCAENDVWSEAAGFNACVAKRYFQTAGAYNKVLKTYCKDENKDRYSAYELGYEIGYDAGVSDTKDEKYETMSREYDNGRSLDYEEGYDDGYAAAECEVYGQGYDAGRAYERSLVDEEKDSVDEEKDSKN